MTSLTTHAPRTVDRSRTSAYSRQIAGVLIAAFALSATHTVYSWVAGINDPSFNPTTPVAWVFYAVGFGSAALALRSGRVVQWSLATYLGVLLWVAIFYYPTTFTLRQQTTFGWVENDVYTGLLMLALYLVVQRLRRVALADRP
jgi:hypothetical protein